MSARKLTDLDKLLRKHDACSEAREFAREHATLESAWAACQRGDWMLWLAVKAGMATRQEIVLTVCAIWRDIAQPHSKDPRSLRAVETAEAWARGEATIEEVRTASAYAASASAAYAAYASAGPRTSTFASAAYAAYAAASDAAYAASDAASAAARSQAFARAAEIVRQRIPLKTATEVPA